MSIEKITAGMTGAQVADLLYANDLENSALAAPALEKANRIIAYDFKGVQPIPFDKSAVIYSGGYLQENIWWWDTRITFKDTVNLGATYVRASNVKPIKIALLKVVGTAVTVIYVADVTPVVGLNTYTKAALGIPETSGVDDLYVAVASAGVTSDRNVPYNVAGGSSKYSIFGSGEASELTDIDPAYWADVNTGKDIANGLTNKFKAIDDRFNIIVADYAPLTSLAAFQAYVNENRVVRMRAGVLDFPAPLNVPSNTAFVGIRGGTRWRLTGGTNIVALSADQQDVQFEGLTMDGNIPITNTGMTLADAKTRAGAGTKSGIFCTGYAKNISVQNIEFVNFDLAGINLYRTHALYTRTFKISDNVLQNNYIGLLSDVRSEYHGLVNNQASYNKIGYFIAGGNNFGANNQGNANGIGIIISGTLGENDSHGSMVGGAFNHNLVSNIYVVDIANGFIFSGVNCFETPITLDNCKGFSFNNGIISSKIELLNMSPAMYNSILNSMFIYGAGVGGTVTGDASKLYMSGNRYLDGRNSDALNNNV